MMTDGQREGKLPRLAYEAQRHLDLFLLPLVVALDAHLDRRLVARWSARSGRCSAGTTGCTGCS